MIQTVVKRDGRIVGFNEQKIMAAIRKAMLHTDKGEDSTLIEQIADHISYRGKSQAQCREGCDDEGYVRQPWAQRLQKPRIFHHKEL